MLSWASAISGLVKLANAFLNLFRDEQIKQSGRDQVAAGNAGKADAARRVANETVKTADDATRVARSRLRAKSGSD